MREQATRWTRKGIFDIIPTKRGSTVYLANQDLLQDTGKLWILTRDRKPYYFDEMWELVDFVLKNSPKTKSRIGQI